jgi:hypothetical protein
MTPSADTDSTETAFPTGTSFVRFCDSLDRAAAHVARREYARQARLQEVRFPPKFLPDVPFERGTIQRPTCQDEAAFVEFEGPSSHPVLASAPM